MVDAIDDGKDPTLSRRRHVALALGTVGFALCFAIWGLIAPLVPQFKIAYQLTATEASVLVAVPVLLGSLARIPIGILTDRYGGRLMFSLLLVFLILPLSLIGLSRSYWELVFWAFWLGLAGSSFAIGVPFVSRWFLPSAQGFALGVYGMGNIGTALANFTAPAIAAARGWQTVAQLAIVPVAAMAVLFWLLGRDAPVASRAGRSFANDLAVLSRRPLALVLSLFYFVTFGGFVAISLYLPTLLVDAYELKPADAAARAAGFVILATLARPIGGYLADRVRAAALLNAVFALIALLAVWLAFEPEMPGLTVAFLGCAFALGIGNGAVFKLVARRFPKETGAVSGMVGAAGGLGGFFPPILLGVVRDATDSYAIGFMLLSEFALLCLVVNLLVVEQRATNIIDEGET